MIKNAQVIITISVLILLIMPFLLTRENFLSQFDFSETGQIGDTIGGITAPFLNITGAILLFYALKAQIKANELVQTQIEKENIQRESDYEATNINQLYEYLEQSITNFKFRSLPEYQLRNIADYNIEETVTGGDAFYKLFSQIRCNFHSDEKELLANQSVSELYSILTIMQALIDRMKESDTKNKSIIMTLIKHQFNYRIITRIRDENSENLNPYFCNECQCNHGLPDNIRTIIMQIQTEIKD